jgi:hypothetical protein
MAFDVYAGGFARFYAREWENVAQKHARETGMEYQIIHAGGDSGPAKWEEVQEAVAHWRAALMNGLRENAPADLDWNEGRDAPYFTDRPGWDGYSALVLMAACVACKEPFPKKIPKDALASDILARTLSPNFHGGFRSITQVQLWLPGLFEFSFDFVDLCNQKTHVGSVQCLNTDLRELVSNQGLSEQQLATSLREAYEDGADFRKIAHFGLAVFSRLADEPLKHRLPIILSF